MPTGSKSKFLFLVMLGLLVVTSGSTFYFYEKAGAAQQDPQKLAQDEIKSVVALVGQHLVLPTGEEPTVATVADPEKLKDQAFFAKAKVGDKLLIYANARQAILYNPESDKVVEVAPLNIGNTAPAAATTPAPVKKK